MTFKTETGDIVMLTMKTAMVVHLVNLSVALINDYSTKVFKDLDLF